MFNRWQTLEQKSAKMNITEWVTKLVKRELTPQNGFHWSPTAQVAQNYLFNPKVYPSTEELWKRGSMQSYKNRYNFKKLKWNEKFCKMLLKTFSGFVFFKICLEIVKTILQILFHFFPVRIRTPADVVREEELRARKKQKNSAAIKPALIQFYW